MMPSPAAPDRLSAAIRSLESGEHVTRAPSGPAIALVSAPDDTGVALNKGNPGARFGPQAFRAALASFSTQYDVLQPDTNLPFIVDSGDAFLNPLPAPDAFPILEERVMLENHADVQARVRDLQREGYITVLIGGGNDFTLPAVSAVQQVRVASGSHSVVGGVNVDPHLDMRERPGSGMPYRRLIDAGVLNPNCFSTVALGRFTNNAEHIAYALSQNVHLVPAQSMIDGVASDAIDEAFERIRTADVGFLSIDIDAIDASHAPGVSARNPAGITPSIAGYLAERAGKAENIRHFELVELSPLLDDPPFDPVDPAAVGRTARLAAYLFRRFVAGVAMRTA